MLACRLAWLICMLVDIIWQSRLLQWVSDWHAACQLAAALNACTRQALKAAGSIDVYLL